jgi:hypothetical protein
MLFLKKGLDNVNDLTEVSTDDRSKHTQAPNKVDIIDRSTRIQDHPKQNAALSIKNDTSPFLAVFVFAKTSKSALSLPPVTSLDIKKQSPSLRKRKALDDDLGGVDPEVEVHEMCIQPKRELFLSDIQLVRGL